MEFLSPGQLKIYLFIVGAVTLLALLITLVVMVPGYLQNNRAATVAEKLMEVETDMTRFIIPESYKHLREDRWMPFRAQRNRWSWEEIEPYWQDPEKLILKYLEGRNEDLIDEIFKDIP